jgi:hypothetical protein
MTKLTDKQKKAVWIVAGILVVIHYAPSLITSFMRQRAAAHFVQAKPSPAFRAPDRAPQIAPPPPAPVPPSPEQVTEQQLAGLVGIWGGNMPVPTVGFCQIRLEVKHGADKSSFTGYSTMSCADVQRFRPGQRSNMQNVNNAVMDATPVSAILSGAIKSGSIELKQDKAIGANRLGCNLTEASLTPFTEFMAVSWKEGPANWKEHPDSACGGGDVVMHRVKTF